MQSYRIAIFVSQVIGQASKNGSYALLKQQKIVIEKDQLDGNIVLQALYVMSVSEAPIFSLDRSFMIWNIRYKLDILS